MSTTLEAVAERRTSRIEAELATYRKFVKQVAAEDDLSMKQTDTLNDAMDTIDATPENFVEDIQLWKRLEANAYWDDHAQADEVDLKAQKQAADDVDRLQEELNDARISRGAAERRIIMRMNLRAQLNTEAAACPRLFGEGS